MRIGTLIRGLCCYSQLGRKKKERQGDQEIEKERIKEKEKERIGKLKGDEDDEFDNKGNEMNQIHNLSIREAELDAEIDSSYISLSYSVEESVYSSTYILSFISRLLLNAQGEYVDNEIEKEKRRKKKIVNTNDEQLEDRGNKLMEKDIIIEEEEEQEEQIKKEIQQKEQEIDKNESLNWNEKEMKKEQEVVNIFIKQPAIIDGQ
ncbi:MAG: hypothetical protein EZS28_033756 [Streblomastix strix]|uniref:Uncharacterized protein n=1 Tax=Streblomastix strix TaxID=222440 RepID=A0A5J4UIV1_9EUKA|nr:MAG: hypothetical protein EZS28_033756 [Streblomastix strix]